MFENTHLLVVDDDPSRRMLTARLLERENPKRVGQVESVAQLLLYLAGSLQEGQPVDLILMDVMMPEVDGIEGCRQVQDIPVCQDIPILMLTSLDDVASLEAAFEAGAMDYVVKTRHPMEMITRVRSALRLKREMDKRKAREQELLELTQQLMQEQKSQQRTSYHDPAVGSLFSQEAFPRILKTSWDQAYSTRSALGLILIRIDHFDSYLLHYGREPADVLLNVIADLLPENTRHHFNIRFEDNIFAVLITDSHPDSLQQQAEQVLEAVRMLKLPHAARQDEGEYVTLSMGCTVQSPQEQPQHTLFLKLARQAVLKANQEGGNRIVCQHG